MIDLLDLAGQVGGLDVTSAETLLGRFVGEGVVQTLANVSIAGVLDQVCFAVVLIAIVMLLLTL